MELDVLLLSRLQFALTIMFHYLFPPLTIGMGIVMVYLEAMYLRTRDPLYELAAKFWTKIFALNFALGVASGIVMEFQFGTNWATYSRFVGDVFGSALAAEGIFAFFLESGFLALLVFGWDRVGPKTHFFATCMVAMGSIFSAVWILVANSWMQTPAGSEIVPIMRDVLDAHGNTVFDANGNVVQQPWIVDGVMMMRAEIVDFWALIFNPSSMDRLVHTLLGCFITGSFFILSISAWYILKGRHLQFAKHSFRGALILGTIFTILIGISGDSNARMVAREQPAKLAAFEGHFHNEGQPAGLYLFGIPNPSEERIDFGVQIPYLLTFLVHRDFTTPVYGLNDFQQDHRPPVAIPFVAFHVMIGVAVFLTILTLVSVYFLWRGTIWDKRWLMWIFVFSILPVIAANQLGWVAAEVGRQPWIVHPRVVVDDAGKIERDAQGYIQYETITKTNTETGEVETTYAGLKTSEALSKAVQAEQVLWSIIMFLLIYMLLGFVWLYVLNKKIQHGPDDPDGYTVFGDNKILDAAARRHLASMTDRKRIVDDLPHTD